MVHPARDGIGVGHMQRESARWLLPQERSTRNKRPGSRVMTSLLHIRGSARIDLILKGILSKMNLR